MTSPEHELAYFKHVVTGAEFVVRTRSLFFPRKGETIPIRAGEAEHYVQTYRGSPMWKETWFLT